ncbi:hypothetical protein B0I08_103398 [Glaciihabitans tibetensis]|uniref:LppA-like lipoprotein n=1 Tax=Glaciihabitans tibetensis TaxID=1266600 RepID=A0A2T0VG63_9MICO|nr:hypothetical protein [Glaciihabitans tibetensis]PRY69190.1 hypothetical protein B0I08_103398 [Glaciihabitans tibetensis]
MHQHLATKLSMAVAVVVLVTLTSCSGQTTPETSPTSSQETEMIDPAQARTDLYAQLDAAQALVGGEWDNSDDSSPMGCTLNSTEGVTFTGTRYSNDTAGEESLAAVAQLWEGMGFTTEARNDVGPYKVIVATSTTDPSHVLRYGLAEQAMYLEGQGACGEGDLYEWVMKIRQESEDATQE